MDYLNKKYMDGNNSEKKISHDKIYEETYINNTPLNERKYYENKTTSAHGPLYRRVSDVVCSKFSDSKMSNFYNDSESVSTNFTIEGTAPKRHPTSIMILKDTDFPHQICENELKVKSHFAKYN
jgi:hypothetical protein